MKTAHTPLKSFCRVAFATIVALIGNKAGAQDASKLRLNKQGYLETRGLNVLVFNNVYDGLFSDAKISGIELIHHDVRTATNGDVRLSPTPAQWDPVPQLIERRVLMGEDAVEAVLAYRDLKFRFTVRAEIRGADVVLSVLLPEPLPEALDGKAGFNLEFLPSAYFRHSYLMDERSGGFPLHPSSTMHRIEGKEPQPLPMATGRRLVLAPENPTRRVAITTNGTDLQLFDGRNTAQNGWFVVRSLLPAGRSGKVVEWTISAAVAPDWVRPPVIGHSQVGYHPLAPKHAILELDKNQVPSGKARVLRIAQDGSENEVFSAVPSPCEPYLRYQYLRLDFSALREPGVYVIDYAGVRTKSFRVAADVYTDLWHPSLDVFLPVQMDHMFVREAYRVWHGRPHRDDARQAPVSYEHFDLYAQGPTTDTRFQPGEHIPGLDLGGWFDAGDFDIRTQTQYAVVLSLVHTWEEFGPTRDQTSVDQTSRRVELHRPDGIPDILQQIEHGTLALLAQHRAVGHAICGIVEPDLGQYTHLGDASTKTDNLVYSAKLKPGEESGGFSGTPDDRWAFTSRSSALNYGSIAALAAASRALKGYRDALAGECLETAIRVWDEEHGHAPDLFRHGNTSGGDLEDEEFKAAVELLGSTRDPKYAKRIHELLGLIRNDFARNATYLLRALPLMDGSYSAKVEELALAYGKAAAADPLAHNPYRVPITTGGWAGSGRVIQYAITHYQLHKAFPRHFDTAPIFAALDFVYGCHPGSDLSLVSGVGTASKELAYGSNRADFSFIAGGVVPGILILKPDFPENKEDWPFLWGENEYVVNLGASHIYLANAAATLVRP